MESESIFSSNHFSGSVEMREGKFEKGRREVESGVLALCVQTKCQNEKYHKKADGNWQK